MRIEEIDYSIDLTQAILWQYSSSPNLLSLINSKQEWYDTNQTEFWEDWYTDVFNLLTANNFGLSVWSIILDIPYLVLDNNNDKPIWGFNELPTINHYVNFNRGTFADISSSRIVLSIEDQRIFLRLRYFQLTNDGTIPLINEFMDLIFNDPAGIYQGGAWALDNFDMTMTYVFACGISQSLLQALIAYDVLSRPDGVELNYVQIQGVARFVSNDGSILVDNNLNPIIGNF